jgi:hypothetical protein
MHHSCRILVHCYLRLSPDTLADVGHQTQFGGLLIAGPNMLETVAVVALRKASLGPVGFDFGKNMGKFGRGDYCLWLLAACQAHKE